MLRIAHEANRRLACILGAGLATAVITGCGVYRLRSARVS